MLSDTWKTKKRWLTPCRQGQPCTAATGLLQQHRASSRHRQTHLQLPLQRSPQLCSELPSQHGRQRPMNTPLHPGSLSNLAFSKLQDSHETWPGSKVHAGGGGAGGGGKRRAIHNLCSTLESSCLANVKHCLGLFWALYFYKGCFEVGEGHREGFLIASTLKNKIPGRKVQGRSLVMWLTPCPVGGSQEALGQAGHRRWALACLTTGELQKEPKPLRSQGGDAEAAHAVGTTSACTITARGTGTLCCPAPQEVS